MTKSLLILGYGGHGRTMADVANDCGYDNIAFVDDIYDGSPENAAARVIGKVSALADLAADWSAAFVAIGNNAIRHKLFLQLDDLGFERPSIIHPSAAISRTAILGDGVFVGRGAIVGTSANIGPATIINTRASIDHDCRIGAANHIAPGATLSGEVITGERVWLGTGCAVKQRVQICSDALVGVGAAVIGNLSVAGTYIGVPAKLARN